MKRGDIVHCVRPGLPCSGRFGTILEIIEAHDTLSDEMGFGPTRFVQVLFGTLKWELMESDVELDTTDHPI